jgi:hypothetical protein
MGRGILRGILIRWSCILGKNGLRLDGKMTPFSRNLSSKTAGITAQRTHHFLKPLLNWQIKMI